MMHTSTPTRVAMAGLGLCLGILSAGCGSDDSGGASATTTADDPTAYCNDLKAGQTDIAALIAGTPDPTRFHALVEQIKNISSHAPDQVASEWKTLADELGAFDDALTAAGIDLTKYAQAAATGKAPTGVTSEQMVAIGSKVGALQDPKIQEYGVTISANAKAICAIDLKPATP